ncbi:EamA family transporter [Desulfovibrio sp.]|uniref:EamA family transporter n=1 Tax=Desulfovibrio sp. TaxID=885 RepID=UPI0023D42C7C|nr:EamA family transporter [Desulfovibrio sp.]MDE7241122.1 EamA family transporter [Desulfovibrio sp.]
MLSASFHLYWPLALVVFANVLYNLSAKSIPRDCSPWTVLVVTYLTASFLSFISYFLFEKDRDFLASLAHTNWTGFALGLSMVGLEVGYIFMYRTGWKISVASLLVNVLLAVLLLFIGLVFYREHLNMRQLAGICLCLLGSFLIMQE